MGLSAKFRKAEWGGKQVVVMREEFTNSLDVEDAHDLVTQLSTQLAELGNGQILQQIRYCSSWNDSLLTWLVHSRCQFGQNLAVGDTYIADRS